MPSKTNTDRIVELERIVATLTERTDNLKEMLDQVGDLRTRIALLEHQVQELRTQLQEASQRRWSLVPVVIAAILGALGMLLVQVLIRTIFGS